MSAATDADTMETGWSGTITDEQQPKPPYKVGVALALVTFLWIGPYLGVQAVLLPAKVAVIAPESKTAVVALLSTSAMIVATIANIIFGALSDLTRTRWGRRTPWIVLGSIACCIMLFVVNATTTVTALVVAWCVYQLFLNAIVAPSIAILSDRTAPKNRGVITSIYALGYSIGLYGGQTIGAQFLDKVSTGIAAMAILTLIAGPLGAVMMREQSSLGMPKKAFTVSMFMEHFSFPMHHARDYYLALCGKFLIVSANFAISGYQLYILTDYMKQDSSQTAKFVSIISLSLMVTAIVMSACAGPISDRIGRRKLPVIIASMCIAIGAIIPFFSAQPWTMIAYGVIAGIGMGAYNAVDQALNIEVLPDPNTAAKDLGILNLANTGGQVLGPVLAATLISAVGYHAIFPMAAACALIGAVLVSLIRSVK
ncbi:MFS transporter [Bifidobacterium margollesii]|uniref:MFS transporter n=1 Tax=Bifidobacterium margollesii TaxID=2020964 RepID=A0A2N5JCK8_9BIFI|nr:MFS transporter [Bifidobacterium margollesii]PLS31948.1 MFS transporter [Bifidobacterium margollesii]